MITVGGPDRALMDLKSSIIAVPGLDTYSEKQNCEMVLFLLAVCEVFFVCLFYCFFADKCILSC